jgi:tetratricopeptide (TPR) repeat protein
MKTIAASIFALLYLWPASAGAQVVAGTAEDKMLRRITSENSAETKLQLMMDFENQFPHSKALPDVYLMAIDVYRQKDDRAKIIEYGERILKLDEKNVTAMMVVARNYALQQKNLEHALELAQRAVDAVSRLKTQPAPPQLTDSQWKDYLERTDASARGILDYVKGVKIVN